MLRTIALDGEPLAVLDEGAGPPLALIHGFPLDHTMWREQIRHLALRFRVLAVDVRGFGGSRQAAGPTSLAQIADDLARLLTALEVGGPIVLCGLSMGGSTSLEFVRRHRQRLRGLVLCDCRAAADTAEARKGRTALIERIGREGPAAAAEAMLPRLFSPRTTAAAPHLVEEMRSLIREASSASLIAALGALANRADLTEYLPRIDMPTQIVVGEDDPISTPEEMKSIAEAIPGARYLRVSGAGHLAPLESPAVVNAALDTFLGSLG